MQFAIVSMRCYAYTSYDFPKSYDCPTVEVTVEVIRIIAEIDTQIEKLQQARSLLAGTQTSRSGRGRPKGSKGAVTGAKKRRLSPSGRRAISEAMKRRWAERRKQLAKS